MQYKKKISSKNITIVENCYSILDVLKILLNEEGFSIVKTFKDSSFFREQENLQDTDLLIIDVVMFSLYDKARLIKLKLIKNMF